MPTTNFFPVLASKEEAMRRGEASRAAGRGSIPGVEFGPSLTVVFVVEDGETLTWVDSEAFEAIGAENPFVLACANLRARTTTPLRRKTIANQGGVWLVGEDDGLDSGRLLLHDLWLPLKAELPGELLVRVPLRGVVLCCSNVPADMAFVDSAAAQLLERATANGATPVATSWLALTEQGWTEVQL